MAALLAREILFPEGPSWGALYVREEGAGYDEPWWVSMPSKVLLPGLAPRDRFLNWERIGDARGRHAAGMNLQVGYRAALELPGELLYLGIGQLQAGDLGDALDELPVDGPMMGHLGRPPEDIRMAEIVGSRTYEDKTCAD